MDSFEEFRAATLFCPKCKVANPVRERLLLVLPEGNMYEYRCAKCGTSVGTKKDKDGINQVKEKLKKQQHSAQQSKTANSFPLQKKIIL
ncbi:MAG: hypothetical protein V1872_03770 [bacterium]